MLTLGDNLNHNFIELSLNETVAAVQGKCGAAYGVVWDADHRPVTLIASEDLANLEAERPLAEIVGQLPPGIIVPVTETMEAFAQSPTFAAFDLGARGAIVHKDKQVVGILTVETITRYLQDKFEPTAEVKGISFGVMLAGSITDKRLIMYCDEYNHRNDLDYYNRHKPPECQVKAPHPHPIRRQK
jgi:hypothetical protein